jgi:adenine deaminase
MNSHSPEVISGQIIDIQNRRMFGGEIVIRNGRIHLIRESENAGPGFILPGLVDAHIHIESSMLTPYEFARKALLHGTVATVSDPHEIANVCGLEGVYYMLENARGAKLKFHFGAPSCVPATTFETAGATIDAADIEKLLQREDILYLSEMMNYPGVLFNDPEVMAKINAAKRLNKPIDGHAPGLMGNDAIKYISAGISTDHECFTLEEALYKLKNGMKVIIREGSAARNFEALHSLISTHTNQIMLCSDDKHPDELIEGHINLLVKSALKKGHQLFDVLQCACINPVHHYKLPVGLLREGDPADFIVIDNPDSFNILYTVINGEYVVQHGQCNLPGREHGVINQFNTSRKNVSDFALKAPGNTIRVIDAIDGQLVTKSFDTHAKIQDEFAVSDPSRDLLKLAVVNRYSNSGPALAFIRNFNLKEGAIASTVAHDSHNIISVGTSDEFICRAVNLLIDSKGGLSAITGDRQITLPLPIAGLMSPFTCEEVGSAYSEIDLLVKKMGCKLRAPFMTLSFMALLVIPELKLSDKGLFNGKTFQFEKLFP